MEEGPAETVKRSPADQFVLTDLKETLKALDDSSEIRWLTDLLPLCLECQTFMSMGNQQGTKSKPNFHGYTESRETSQKSPRIQIPRKRRKRVEGLFYTGAFQHNLKTTPGTPRAHSKARRLTKLRITSSPAFEEWDLEEDRPITCTPAARRKRVMGKERVSLLEERSQQELKPAWRVKLPDASSANFPFSRKGLFCPGEDLSGEEECALPDSDTDLSEYDNDMYSTYISTTCLELAKKTEDNTRITQAARKEEKKAESVEKKSSHWRYEEMEKKAAAQRVMGKIEEVEGIIRRVSLTSSDWIRDGQSDGRDEGQFISDGGVDVKQHRAEFGSQLETQNKQCSEDKPLVAEELQALGEALSQSLRQVLRMEGAKAESGPLTEAKKTSYTPNVFGSTRRPLNPPSYSYHFTSTMPNNSSSPSLSAGGETSPVPSPSLSAILDASPRTSSSFEGMSPILSPLFTSSASSHHSLPLSRADQREEDASERSHVGWISSAGDSLFPQGTGGCGSAPTISGGTGSDQKNSRKSEQDQTYRCTSETEASQDYLLSSGNNANYATSYRAGQQFNITVYQHSVASYCDDMIILYYTFTKLHAKKLRAKVHS